MSKTEQVVHVGKKIYKADRLQPSGNRKLSPVIRKKKGSVNAGEPLVHNSHGTLSSHCRFTTPFCEGCYAKDAENYPSVVNLLTHNTNLVEQSVGYELVRLFDNLIMNAYIQMEKHNVPIEERIFRVHWDGDLGTVDELEAWNVAAKMCPDMSVFLYTRAHPFVSKALLNEMSWADNFVVYLSVDKHNIASAKAVKQLDKQDMIRMAFCGDTWEETLAVAEQFPDQRKGARCPELTGKIDMIVWDSDLDEWESRKTDAEQAGKKLPALKGKGACVACNMCPRGINNVRFAQKG
tara:strand:- start:144 stop:1022 length:879 start_codon:yes stop_codon:yes gene_type:complete